MHFLTMLGGAIFGAYALYAYYASKRQAEPKPKENPTADALARMRER